MLASRNDAYALLYRLGAPERLLKHVQLVGEAADALMARYRDLGLVFDGRLIELGVALHDAGKILHPEEMNGPGSRHEATGETLMLQHGVEPAIARCCISHAAWRAPGITFEELSIALADKLWKGKREPDLELAVIDKAADRLSLGRWDIFEALDAAFENIAAEGDDRLRRSRPV